MAKIHINNPKQVINGGAKKYYFKVKGLGGPKGDKGDKGDTGATGPEGPQGNAATVSIGSTTTLPVGNDATVTNSGSIYNAVLNFGIPQGPRGPQGATGAKGDKGDKGDQGNPGPQGEKGTNATVYIGTTTTGEPGTQASVYNSGTSSNAVLNFTIPRGDVGPMPTIAQTTGQAADQVMSQKATTNAIANETSSRQNADIGLQSQIDAITSKSDVVDVVATYADLQAYDTQHLGDNDVIKVLDDETHGDALTYYRWSKTNQTWTFIGQEAPYYSKSQTDTLLLGKQNTIDSSHKLSADLVDDTSTTNKFVTASDITNWNGKQDALTAGTGIDITGDVISTPAIVPEVVAELPTTGTEGKLYLTPKNYTRGTGTGNPIEATITDEAGEMESFKLDGDTFQQSYTGKNLYYDTDGYNQGFLGNNGEIALSAESVTNATYVEASKNTQYVMSFNDLYGGITFRGVAFYDANKNFISRTQPSYNNSFTTPQNTAYIRVYFYNANGLDATNFPTNYISDIQLELGSTATSFEPFVGGQPSPNPDYPQTVQTVTGTQTISINGTNYPLALGDIQLCGLGDDGNGNPLYKDRIYKDGSDWKIHKAVGKYQIDGSENWIKQTATDIYYRATDISVPSTTIGYCNYLRVQQAGTTVFAMSNCISFSGFATDVFISPSSTFADVGAFTTWLGQVKPIAYYPLATATDTTITDQTLIAQLDAIRTASLQNGTNTITNTATGTNLAGDMEIGYYGFNPRNRYDKWLWLDINNNYEQIGS